MKFIEYAAMSNHLEEKGSSINEFVEEITGKPLNEAKPKEESEIETSRAGKGFHSPAFALKRKKLNGLAKKFLKEGKEKVIAKYAPKILNSTKNLITKSAALSKQGKSPGEINKLLSGEAEKGVQIQDKSTKRLDTILDKYNTHYEKRAKALIEKGDLSEKSKDQLDMYWSLLSLQVMQAFDKAMVKYREDMIEGAVANNAEMEKMLKLMTQSPDYQQQLDDYENKVKKAKADYKAAEEGGDKKEKEFAVGEIYQYTNAKGESTNIEITKVKEDGKIVGKTKSKPDGFVINKDKVGNKLVDSDGNKVAEKKVEKKPEKKPEPVEA